jgi:hypothetical protein
MLVPEELANGLGASGRVVDRYRNRHLIRGNVPAGTGAELREPGRQ